MLLPLSLDLCLSEECDSVVSVTAIRADVQPLIEAEVKLCQVLWTQHPVGMSRADEALASISGRARQKPLTDLDMHLLEEEEEEEAMALYLLGREEEEEEEAFVLPPEAEDEETKEVVGVASAAKGKEEATNSTGITTKSEADPTRDLMETVERLASVVGLHDDDDGGVRPRRAERGTDKKDLEKCSVS